MNFLRITGFGLPTWMGDVWAAGARRTQDLLVFSVVNRCLFAPFQLYARSAYADEPRPNLAQRIVIPSTFLFLSSIAIIEATVRVFFLPFVYIFCSLRGTHTTGRSCVQGIDASYNTAADAWNSFKDILTGSLTWQIDLLGEQIRDKMAQLRTLAAQIAAAPDPVAEARARITEAERLRDDIDALRRRVVGMVPCRASNTPSAVIENIHLHVATALGAMAERASLLEQIQSRIPPPTPSPPPPSPSLASQQEERQRQVKIRQLRGISVNMGRLLLECFTTSRIQPIDTTRIGQVRACFSMEEERAIQVALGNNQNLPQTLREIDLGELPEGEIRDLITQMLRCREAIRAIADSIPEPRES